MKKLYIFSLLSVSCLYCSAQSKSAVRAAVAKSDSLNMVKDMLRSQSELLLLSESNVSAKRKSLDDAKKFKALRTASDKERDIKAAQFEYDKAVSESTEIESKRNRMRWDSARLEAELSKLRK